PLAQALSDPASAGLDTLSGVERDGRLGGSSRAQIPVPRDLLVGRPGGALPQRLSRPGTAIGYEAAADQLGWACPIYVAQTDERAREEAGRAVETLFNDFLRQSFEMLMPPGYTSIGSMKNFIRDRTALGGGRLTAQALIESGTALIGSPRTVLAGIERMRERTGFGILVALLQFGILSDDLTRRNMDLFAAEVMPHLRD